MQDEQEKIRKLKKQYKEFQNEMDRLESAREKIFSQLQNELEKYKEDEVRKKLQQI
jgi:hypothetical protein